MEFKLEDGGHVNLLIGALNIAASEANHPGADGDPGEYLEVRDRIQAQFGPGPASDRAIANLKRIDNGVPFATYTRSRTGGCDEQQVRARRPRPAREWRGLRGPGRRSGGLGLDRGRARRRRYNDHWLRLRLRVSRAVTVQEHIESLRREVALWWGVYRATTEYKESGVAAAEVWLATADDFLYECACNELKDTPHRWEWDGDSVFFPDEHLNVYIDSPGVLRVENTAGPFEDGR